MTEYNPLTSSLHMKINAQLNDKNLKDDRKKILEISSKATYELYLLGICIIPYIIRLFQNYGFKRVSLYSKIICNYIAKIKKDFNKVYPWLNLKKFDRGNKSDKNIIICLFLFTYKEHFVSYLQDYLSEIEQNKKENIKILISKLQRLINDAPKNNILHLHSFNQNISEEDNTNGQNNNSYCYDDLSDYPKFNSDTEDDYSDFYDTMIYY